MVALFHKGAICTGRCVSRTAGSALFTEVDTREDLHAWLDRQANRAALRTVRGVGPKSVDYMANLVGRSHVAVDVHLRAFAVDAGVPDLPYDRLRTVYEEAAALLGHDQGALEHAVWRHRSKAP
ncbi:hypothetical protein [Streptomyces sp. NPDC102283]|uniref:hypothetical protein n=1 Tax=Streptomyces sp. NPDC102283 TaxID=3366155 RepID=UPI00382A64BD